MKKFKVGSTVKVIKNENLSINPVGSIGIISELHSNGRGCRVIVKGYSDDNTINNMHLDNLELILTKQDKIEKLLKKISKLNKE